MVENMSIKKWPFLDCVMYRLSMACPKKKTQNYQDYKNRKKKTITTTEKLK